MTKRPPAPRRKAAKAPNSAKVPAGGARAPGYDDILAIARLIESGSRFSEFRLRSGDIEVEVRRGNPGEAAVPAAAVPAAAVLPGAVTAPPAKPDARTPGATPPELPAGAQIVRSPMVGTFFRAAGPGDPPFVEPGSRVEPDTVVCIIEVMKLMNSVVAGVSGVVIRVFVDNAQSVEYGQPLIAIEPAP